MMALNDRITPQLFRFEALREGLLRAVRGYGEERGYIWISYGYRSTWRGAY